jgi:hypothetical protein
MRILAVFLLFFSVSLSAHAQQMPPSPPIGEALVPVPPSMPSAREFLRRGHQADHDLEERYNRMRTDSASCVDTEKRISYYRMDHCKLHALYQTVFPQAGCHCSTGQCRPTVFKRVPPTPENPSGVLVEVDGKFYAPPETAMRKMVRGKVPDTLMEYEAHVCAFHNAEEVIIECLWIDDNS